MADTYFKTQLTSNPDYSIQFETDFKVTAHPFTLFTQLTGAPESAMLSTSVIIINHSDQPFVFRSTDATLMTDGGDFSRPINFVESDEILPGESLKQELLFSPVNNRRLFMRTGLRGDLNSKYELRLNLPNVEVTQVFKMPEEVWQNYLADHAIESNLKLFSPAIDQGLQQQHQLSAGKTDFVHVDESEISIEGTNLQFNAFHWADTLNIHIKIVNHGNDKLSVLPQYLAPEKSGLSPLIGNEQEPIELRKSQRFIQKYKYYYPDSLEAFTISKEFLVSASKHEDKLLAQDVRFSLTKF